mmetsp:Transcript_173417/g.421787  ORF Transcript_173417/g.421787 Transcript_173417/m.421787 type:complete len:233 (+) Transcript_173417:480-1178(+)
MSLASMRSSTPTAMRATSSSNSTVMMSAILPVTVPASAWAAAPPTASTRVILMSSSRCGSAARNVPAKASRISGITRRVASKPVTVMALSTRAPLVSWSLAAMDSADQTTRHSSSLLAAGRQGMFSTSMLTVGVLLRAPATEAAKCATPAESLSESVEKTAILLCASATSLRSAVARPEPNPKLLPARAISATVPCGTCVAAMGMSTTLLPLASMRQPWPMATPVASAKLTW